MIMLTKKIFYLCAIFTLFNFVNPVNSGEVIYQVSLNRNKIEESIKKNQSSEASKHLKLLLKNASDVEYSLKFSRDESIYKHIKSMENEAKKGINLTKIFAGNLNTIYYNNISKECLDQTTISGETFLIIKDPVIWKLTSISKTISDYKCFKAVCLDSEGKESDVIAWYAPAISFNYGPGRFNGLPGLILELEDKSVTFRAKNIKLNKKDIKIKRPNKGTAITYDEFKKRFGGIFDEN